MLAAISSWTANTSSRSRSKRLDQSWKPSSAVTSWTATRRRRPDLRTLPSRTVATLRARAISRTSSRRSRKANDEVRDATRSASSLDSELMISSAMPSAKYWFSGSALRLAKGSTATELRACSGGGSGRLPPAMASSWALSSAALA